MNNVAKLRSQFENNKSSFLQPLTRALVEGQKAFSCYAFSNMANVKQFSGGWGYKKTIAM